MLERRKIENFVKRYHPEVRLEVRKVEHGIDVVATEFRFEVEKSKNLWIMVVHDLGEKAHAHLFSAPKGAQGRTLIWASIFCQYTFPIENWDDLKKRLKRIIKYYD